MMVVQLFFRYATSLYSCIHSLWSGHGVYQADLKAPRGGKVGRLAGGLLFLEFGALVENIHSL